MGDHDQAGQAPETEEEREFYLNLRRALLQMARAIEKRYMEERAARPGGRPARDE